jgi:adenine-specific DNA-methyltransferase
MYWRVSEENFWQMDADNRIWWGKSGDNIPQIKRFLSEVKQGVTPRQSG